MHVCIPFLPHFADYFAAFVVNFVINIRVYARLYCNNYLSLTAVVCSFNKVVESGKV